MVQNEQKRGLEVRPRRHEKTMRGGPTSLGLGTLSLNQRGRTEKPGSTQETGIIQAEGNDSDDGIRNSASLSVGGEKKGGVFLQGANVRKMECSGSLKRDITPAFHWEREKEDRILQRHRGEKRGGDE